MIYRQTDRWGWKHNGVGTGGMAPNVFDSGCRVGMASDCAGTGGVGLGLKSCPSADLYMVLRIMQKDA